MSNLLLSASLQTLVIEFIASFLIWGMYAGILLLWVIDGRIKKEVALHALLASGICWVGTTMLKDLFDTQRPFIINNLPTSVFIRPTNGAFPSAHAATTFAIAVTVWLHNKKWGIVFIVMAILIGIARVLGNVHYPIDILGGIIIGTIVAVCIEKVHLWP